MDRMPVGHHQPHYPSENQDYFYDPEMAARGNRNHVSDMRLQEDRMNRELMWEDPTPLVPFFATEPPSWADIQISGRPIQRPFHRSPAKFNTSAWQEVKKEDVFSTMGMWEAPPTKKQQHHQASVRQPPPAPKHDVFANIGKWNPNEVQQTPKVAPKLTPMSLNMMTPINRAPSLESPTTSLESSPEEKNSWTSFELLLNPKSSRSSDSGSEYSSPIDPYGHWNSNLPKH
ncbi:hypothetical protein B9Z55_001959 [Caenorhabditis nigoni]|uniref:Uncharacterized protein n=1 Tax=Caenorhabditis nigoni TaxID=1611254 RepID=A0A2G5VI21_9PELO|nr:hypothetical protein B9Z55_001959 [Caenorhabditis nigoni]